MYLRKLLHFIYEPFFENISSFIFLILPVPLVNDLCGGLINRIRKWTGISRADFVRWVMHYFSEWSYCWVRNNCTPRYFSRVNYGIDITNWVGFCWLFIMELQIQWVRSRVTFTLQREDAKCYSNTNYYSIYYQRASTLRLQT